MQKCPNNAKTAKKMAKNGQKMKKSKIKIDQWSPPMMYGDQKWALYGPDFSLEGLWACKNSPK